ncbi:hypothetical protein P4O66_003580 [Electrophorus voltai]|uniref:Uncharacterized protein n=1 Tax=Electrophorus voltai TaxID=2609070 RepID=A0AAD8ZUU8_9TELE|nr:hypothetical protein P4O66_003580 [Electrophorus voltai]
MVGDQHSIAPYAQCSGLGWVIISEAYLDKAHRPKDESAFHTQILNIQEVISFPTTTCHHLKDTASQYQVTAMY